MNLKILTPEELVHYLTEWKSKNPSAYQLDGSTKQRNNSGAFCYFTFAGRIFKLQKDTNIHGVNRFLRIANEVNEKYLFAVNRTSDCWTITLSKNRGQADGWFCREEVRFRDKKIKSAA